MACDPNPPNSHQIPNSLLERMGLWVIDQGDGGDCASAVDPLDTDLRVVTSLGDPVYTAPEDGFKRFELDLQDILGGKRVTIEHTTGNWPRQTRWVTFDRGGIEESGELVEPVEKEGSNGYVEGDVTRFEKGAPVSASHEACYDGLCTRAWDDIRYLYKVQSEPEKDGSVEYTVTDKLSGKISTTKDPAAAMALVEGLIEKHKEIRIQPTPWGYQVFYHGIPVRIYPDPWFGVLNLGTVPAVLRALNRLPLPLVRMLSEYRREISGKEYLAFHFWDKEHAASDWNLAKRRLKQIGSSIWNTTVGNITTGDLETEMSFSDPVSLLGLKLNLDYLSSDAKGAFYDLYSAAVVTCSVSNIDTTTQLHEVGHAVQLMLGGEFYAEFKALYERYMNLAPKVVGGWFPTGNSTTNASEFWADLFMTAFDDNTPKPYLHYFPIMNAIRIAVTKGGTPEEIRKIFREQIAGF